MIDDVNLIPTVPTVQHTTSVDSSHLIAREVLTIQVANTREWFNNNVKNLYPSKRWVLAVIVSYFFFHM